MALPLCRERRGGTARSLLPSRPRSWLSLRGAGERAAAHPSQAIGASAGSLSCRPGEWEMLALRNGWARLAMPFGHNCSWVSHGLCFQHLEKSACTGKVCVCVSKDVYWMCFYFHRYSMKNVKNTEMLRDEYNKYPYSSNGFILSFFLSARYDGSNKPSLYSFCFDIWMLKSCPYHVL